ncbi:hypothetical protein F183_A16100 [Bryobacterales bacterium F-183]|nr:hypothetical protein F183_A16100 [Bryobacterales bacterium F-183]
MTVRITEAEFSNDVRTFLDRAAQGDEVTIERGAGTRPIFLTVQQPPHRHITLDESIARARELESRPGYQPFVDDDFAKDLEEIVASRRHEYVRDPWNDE